MYKSGVDVIFHASGDTGNGVFAEAKDIMKTKPEEKFGLSELTVIKKLKVNMMAET